MGFSRFKQYGQNKIFEMNYLVLGATGFIGRHIVNELLRRRRPVTILTRRTDSILHFKAKNIRVVLGDLLNMDSLLFALTGVEIVIHSAAYVSDWGPRRLFLETNVDGTGNLLKVCLNTDIKRLVYISTYDVFNFRSHLISEETAKMIKSHPYPYSKLLAENLVWKYKEEYNLPITVIYPPWVYGPGDRHLLPEIVKALKKKRLFYFSDKGNNYIELCYVTNLARAVVDLSETDIAVGESYVVSDGTRVTFRQFVERIAELTNLEKPKLSLPYPISYGIAYFLEILYKIFRMKCRPVITRNAVELLGRSPLCDTTKLQRLGFKPKAIPFDEGLRNAVADLRL